MTVELSTAAFDPWQRLVAYQGEHLRRAGFGATAVFVGTMRDFNDGEPVDGMVLEHYPGMTERQLEKIVRECTGEHEVLEVLLVHRVGEIAPGEPIVLVAVWSAHRAEAFTVCRALMEALKQRAPFWKRERTGAGERWISENTPGEPARAKKSADGD